MRGWRLRQEGPTLDPPPPLEPRPAPPAVDEEASPELPPPAPVPPAPVAPAPAGLPTSPPPGPDLRSSDCSFTSSIPAFSSSFFRRHWYAMPSFVFSLTSFAFFACDDLCGSWWQERTAVQETGKDMSETTWHDHRHKQAHVASYFIPEITLRLLIH